MGSFVEALIDPFILGSEDEGFKTKEIALKFRDKEMK